MNWGHIEPNSSKIQTFSHEMNCLQCYSSPKTCFLTRFNTCLPSKKRIAVGHTSKCEKNCPKVVRISPFGVGPNVHFTPAKNYATDFVIFATFAAQRAAIFCSCCHFVVNCPLKVGVGLFGHFPLRTLWFGLLLWPVGPRGKITAICLSDVSVIF